MRAAESHVEGNRATASECFHRALRENIWFSGQIPPVCADEWHYHLSIKGLQTGCQLCSIGFTMKLKNLFSVVVAGTLAFSSTASAAGTKTYQVTGPVLEMNDNMIAVQKGKDRWEIARDSSTKVTGDLKVGAKVTITYTMTATDVELKAAKSSAKKP